MNQSSQGAREVMLRLGRRRGGTCYRWIICGLAAGVFALAQD
jgi:hypothetical protein